MIRAVILIAWVLAPRVARADDKADASALFDEGIREIKAGNHAKACKALAASNKLVPDSGTRGSLARCYALQGKVVSSWRLWRELAETAPTPDLRADAAANAAKLDPRLPKYVIVVTGEKIELEVLIDGQVVEARLDVPVPIDPGTYHVEVRAANYNPWKTTFTAVEGKLSTIEIPTLARLATAPKPDPTPDPGRDRDKPRSHRKLFGLGFVSGGAIVAIGGGVFGAMARSRFEDAKDICGGSIDRCEPARLAGAQDTVDRARSAATISTVMFAAGGALAVAGIVMIVTAPSAGEARVTLAPSVGAGVASLTICGGF